MSTGYSEAAQAEAALALQRLQITGRGEAPLDVFDSRAPAVSESFAVSTTPSVTASVAFDMVKDQVSHLAKSSKSLVQALNEVGKVHLFIQIAVSAFEEAITLELARRENDQKVLALNMTMCDMMRTMTLLEKVASPKDQGSDGITIEQRLQGRMNDVVDSIKRCAVLCESYQNRYTVVRFFTKIKWQSMFATIAAQFMKHKSNLESDLRLHLDIVRGMLESIDHKVPVMKAMMELVFEEMQSPEEKEWTALAQRSGGIERFLESDELLKEMLEKQKFGVEKGSGQMPSHR